MYVLHEKKYALNRLDIYCSKWQFFITDYFNFFCMHFMVQIYDLKFLKPVDTFVAQNAKFLKSCNV